MRILIDPRDWLEIPKSRSEGEGEAKRRTFVSARDSDLTTITMQCLRVKSAAPCRAAPATASSRRSHLVVRATSKAQESGAKKNNN